ncbi:MAG: xanthine dehydrogenase family protein molybdopterin-binding subunit [Planctomycetota bacterium]|nr:xanthine dehydrogenase family protein molybdopterin-binding subunit [Planctomycetota bacterium]
MTGQSMHRRELLRGLAFGGGLLLAVRFGATASADPGPLVASPEDAAFAPNAFVRIAGDGRVTVIINKAEMGQGVSTALAMIVAEDLDADWKQVGFEFAPADLVYAHPGFGIQMTGGSTSVAGMTPSLQKAGATARAMLVAAAAQKLGVPLLELTTESGSVVHAASKRRLGYGELVADAAKLAVPTDAPVKDRKDYRIVGRSTKRLDTPDKVRGKAQFGIDVTLPGMVIALVARAPVFGGKVRSFRAEKAKAIAGVRDVVQISSGVAVIADRFWAAKRARDLLEIDWDLGAGASTSSEKLRAEYAALAQKPGMVGRRDGDAPSVVEAAGSKAIEALYELPYLAHAPMETLNCTVRLTADACEIWTGTQFQTVDQGAAAAVAGLKSEQVKIHTTFLGGGFGRRANPKADFVVEAVEVAKLAHAPVKVIWTRDDDLRGGYYRPMWTSRMRATLDARGRVEAWVHTIVGQSFMAGTPFEAAFVKNGIDSLSIEGSEDTPYAIPNVQVELHTTNVVVPTLWWRSVGHSHTAFVIESFVDELAARAKADPLEFRREMLKDKPRHRAVLERAAKESGWGTPLPAGRARGIAQHFSFGSYVAIVMDASIERGRPRVHRATVAIDCGRVVNPDTVVAQMQSAVGFGLTTALYSAITLKDGRVDQSNFHDYPMLRIHEMPTVDVHILESNEPSSGVGEPGVPPIAPALGNALFALTKKPIRRLPIRSEDLA